MPRIKRKVLASRRSWTGDEHLFLSQGMMFGSHDHPWYRFRGSTCDEIPPQILEDIAAGWEHFRDELMAECASDVRGNAGRRPRGWWMFDAPDFEEIEDEPEAETLYRLGLLTPAERAELTDRVRGWDYISHQCLPFRRPWDWWAFKAPEQRDKSASEVTQLMRLGRSYLTDREQYILDNATDEPGPIKVRRRENDPTLSHLGLTNHERRILGLPQTTPETSSI